MKNLLVRTKFYWSWAEGPVLIVRTAIYRYNGPTVSLPMFQLVLC